MSTLTSLVKSGKRKIIKTKAEQTDVGHKRDGVNMPQKAAEAAGSGTLNERTGLGRLNRDVSKDPTRP